MLETATGRPVFLSRVKTISPDELPCMIVTTNNEASEPLTVGKSRTRIIELAIHVYERAFDDVDDIIDSLCVQIENAILNDTTISSKNIDLDEVSIEISNEGDQPIAVATMLYAAKFVGVRDPEQLI